MDKQKFFNHVRSMFRGGRLSAAQVHGMELILRRCESMRIASTAYVLATAFHETGQRMEPVREGFARSNEGAIRAVTGLFDKGIIRTNYALPHKDNGQSYYGRGFVQITWRENYAKLGKMLGVDLENDPDLALDPTIATECLVQGMVHGVYRKNLSLSMIPDRPNLRDYAAARGMINGDVRKNGLRIARYAAQFYDGMKP